jgi:hypothetical protein
VSDALRRVSTAEYLVVPYSPLEHRICHDVVLSREYPIVPDKRYSGMPQTALQSPPRHIFAAATAEIAKLLGGAWTTHVVSV